MSETRIQRAMSGRTLVQATAGRAGPFTVESARSALVYVCRVAEDASNAFHTALKCRHGLVFAENSALRAELAEQRDHALRRLNAAIDECNAVGADLIDIASGLVRFAGVVDGRRVSLIWRLGAPIEHAWDNVEEPAAEPER